MCPITLPCRNKHMLDEASDFKHHVESVIQKLKASEASEEVR